MKSWVRLRAMRGELSSEHPSHQARLHRVIDIDSSGRVLTACHRAVFQRLDPYQIHDGTDDRPKCQICLRSQLHPTSVGSQIDSRRESQGVR